LAHFALQKLHILPSTLVEMSDRERAFIYASIQLRIEEEKKEAAKIKATRNKGRRGGRRR